MKEPSYFYKVCTLHIQNHRSLLHNGQEACLISHLSMQGRWNMWWQWGKLLPVSPSWKSCKSTVSQIPISKCTSLATLFATTIKKTLTPLQCIKKKNKSKSILKLKKVSKQSFKFNYLMSTKSLNIY